MNTVTSDVIHLRAVLDRLTRLAGTGDWDVDLNPAQMAALSYLARANRFSRSPSHVAAFFGATRGTMSQTLKALHRKGLLDEDRPEHDRRRMSYTPSDAGQVILNTSAQSDAGLGALDAQTCRHLTETIGAALSDLITRRGAASFGICHSCRFHQQRDGRRHCTLLDLALADTEASQLCHEHQPPASQSA